MLLVQTIIAWLHVFLDTIISRNDALFASIPSFSYKNFKAPFPLGSIKHGTAWNSLSYPLFFQIEAHASLTIYCFISTFQWTVFIQNLMECACIGIIYEFSPAFKRINFLLSTDGIFVVVQQSTWKKKSFYQNEKIAYHQQFFDLPKYFHIYVLIQATFMLIISKFLTKKL